MVSLYERVYPVAVAEDASAMHGRRQTHRQPDRWAYRLAQMGGQNEVLWTRELGGMQTLKWFLQMNEAMGGHGVAEGQQLQMTREVKAAAAPGGWFCLRNRHAVEIDTGKVWHLLGLALLGCQIDHCQYIQSASWCVVDGRSSLTVTVSRCNEMVINVLRHSLMQIVSMTEGHDAWVDYAPHPPAPIDLPVKIVPPPQPQQPVAKPARGPPGHRKSRSTPQQVEQSFLDEHQRELAKLRGSKKNALTDIAKDVFVPKQSLAATCVPRQNVPATTAPPPPKKEVQIPPPFVSKGLAYPSGLPRKVRRSIQFKGMQGHQVVEVPEGIPVRRQGVLDGVISEELYKELVLEAEKGRARMLSSVRSSSTGSVANREDVEPQGALRRVASCQALLSSAKSYSFESEGDFVSVPESLANIDVANWADDTDEEV